MEITALHEWDDMKINFTKNEYRFLLDMVEIAEWVLNAHKSKPSDEVEKYSELYQKILSHAKEMGLENHIVYDKDLEGYFATAEYEEAEPMRYIGEFEDDVFWDALPRRLAVRDLVKEVGENKYEEMEFVEGRQNWLSWNPITTMNSKSMELITYGSIANLNPISRDFIE